MTAKNLLVNMDLKEKNYIYLTKNTIPNKHKIFVYNEGERLINLSYEPNDLFVKCTYTNVSKVEGIVYFVNNQPKLFEKFINDINKKVIQEITVYFLRYNDTPLYLTVMTTPMDNPGYQYRFNYKINKNGDWEQADNYFYLFGELKSQALKFNMIQYFEIEKTEKDYPRDRIGKSHPHIDVYRNKTGEFKFYKHLMEENLKITKFFTYKDRLLKDIIITDKGVHEIDVYYHAFDRKNTLPLMIIVHMSDKTREYFINKGGNYKWQEDKENENYYGNENKLAERLNDLRGELMGELISLELDYIPIKNKITKYDDHQDIFCFSKYEGDLKYTSCKFYSDGGKRFSIYELKCNEYQIKFPDLTLCSIQKFYTFHSGTYELPLFLCSVYETYHNEVYDWYELSDRKDSRYEVSYLLSGDPDKFVDLFDVLRIYETRHFQLDFEIPKSVLIKNHDGNREVIAIDDHDFDKHNLILEGNHKRFVLSPTYGNFFTIKSLVFFDEKALVKEFKPVKEVYVFEHYNYFHYKVCIVTSEYNYTTKNEDKKYHWYEFRKGTNVGDKWTMIGKLKNIKKLPHYYETPEGIKEIMDENIIREYEDGHKKVYYKPQNHYFPHIPYREYGPGFQIPTKIEISGEDLEANQEEGETGGGLSPLAGGLIGSGAGVGIVSAAGGYLIYSNMGAISNALSSLMK